MKGLTFTLLALTSSSAVLTLSSTAGALTSDPSTNYCYVTLCAGDDKSKTYFEDPTKDNDNNRTFKISKGWNYKKLKETYTLPTPHNINRTQDDEGYYFAYWSNDEGRHEVADDYIINDDITFTAKYYIDIKGEDKWKTDSWAKISQIAEKGITIDDTKYVGLEALIKYYQPDGDTFVPRYYEDEALQLAEITKKKRSVNIKQADGTYKAYDVICVAENHDKVYNVSGNLEVGCLTFQFIDIVNAGMCYDFEDQMQLKTFTYENSFVKKYIENIIYKNFEDDLKDSIQNVSKTVALMTGYDDEEKKEYKVETSEVNCKLYLPSANEMTSTLFASNSNRWSDAYNNNLYFENNNFDYQYRRYDDSSYYSSSNYLIKKYNGTALNYYCRSLSSDEDKSSNPRACSISSSGYLDQYFYSGYSYGVCPCFTIGIDKTVSSINNGDNTGTIQVTADPFYSLYAYKKNARNYETIIENLKFISKGALTADKLSISIYNPDSSPTTHVLDLDKGEYSFVEDYEEVSSSHTSRCGRLSIPYDVLETYPGDITIKVEGF